MLVTWTNIHFTGHHLKHTKPTFNIISGEVIIGIPQTELLAATSLPFFFFRTAPRTNIATWLVVLTILKNMSSSMGRMTSHIVLWKIKAMFETTNQQQYIGDYTTIQQYCNISILSAYYQHISHYCTNTVACRRINPTKTATLPRLLVVGFNVVWMVIGWL